MVSLRTTARASLISRALLFILAFGLAPAVGQQSAPLPADKIEKIEKVISAEMSRSNIPGLSVAVVTDNKLRWSNGYGLADVENSVPAKAATVYRLASISKTITAVAAMQLAERGKLDLDAPVQKYCPAFPEKQWPVTTRQLLGHLGGVRHYKSIDEVRSTKHYDSVTDALEMFKDDPLVQEPGTKYTYTTFGYVLLGCVVEGASGMKFTNYVSENIFKPAGMDRIRADSVFEIILNRAQGYEKASDGTLRNSRLADTSNKIPGGGFCSTAQDLAKFAIAVNTGLLLKKETLAQMWTKQKTSDGKETGYGLGWGIAEHNGQKWVGHGGAQQRVSTYLYILPDKGVAVAVMANLEGVGGRLQDLSQQIGDILMQ